MCHFRTLPLAQKTVGRRVDWYLAAQTVRQDNHGILVRPMVALARTIEAEEEEKQWSAQHH